MLNNLSFGKKLALISIGSIVLLGLLQVFSIYKYDIFLSDMMQRQKLLSSLLLEVKSAQVEFKIEVQEWKNVLIRGHNPSKYEKYQNGLKKQISSVKEHVSNARKILKHFPDAREVSEELDRFDAKWEMNNQAYFDALKKYPFDANGDNALTYRLLDKEVSGVDRAPNKLLDNIAHLTKKFLDKNMEDELANAHSFKLKSYITFTIFVIFIVIFAQLIAQNIKKRIKDMQKIAQDFGDLTKRLDENGSDELAKINGLINQFLAKTQETIAQAKSSANDNATISEELSATAMQVGKGVEKTVNSIEEESRSMSKIARLAEATSQSSNKVAKLAKKSKDELDESASLIENISNNIDENVQSQITLSQKLKCLQDEAGDVKNILSVIGDIADQTNLLSLNAAIEAARAGQHGKGFAVVADEISELALKTQKSLTQTNGTIATILQSINDISEEMVFESESIKKLGYMGKEVSKKTKDVSKMSLSMLQTMRELDSDIEGQTHLSKDVEKTTKEVSEEFGQNARSIQEINTAIEHLSSENNKLNMLLTGFKV